jgi:hypothetical protein
MKMIAVRLRQIGDENGTLVIRWPPVPRQVRERLQQGQSLELKRIEVERIFLGWHGSSGTSGAVI